jgi:rod shape-determining protein MreC
MDQVAATPRKIFGLYLISLFVLLVIISYQVNDPVSGRSVLGSVIFRLLSPAQLIIAETADGIYDLARTYFVLVKTNQDNERLRRELADLKIQLSAVRHQQVENDRLRRIVQLKQNVPYELIVGEVIGRDAKAALSQTIAVNRGTRNSIKRQLPVVTPDGIVGMVVQADLFTSRILLITDATAYF